MPRASMFASLLVSLAMSAGPAAISAQADERCTGTLCDFYYGDAPAEAKAPAKPAAPTPIMVPKNGILGFFSNGGQTQGASASGTAAPTSRFQVQGGGLLGLARGETPERCTGTLCDAFYGGPPPEKPDTPAAPAATQADATQADAAQADVDEAPRASRRRSVEFVERVEKPRCASTPQDPWRCYR